MTPIVYLHEQVKAVCPNMQGVNIGRWTDKSTWDITGPVTQAEHDAAQVIFKEFNKVAWEAAQPPQRTIEERLTALEAR